MKILSKHLLKYSKRLASIQKGSCLKISTLVVTRTPVDEGSARRSWTPSIGVMKAENIDAKTSSKRHDIQSVVGKLKIGETYHFANGQPYIRPLEYEGLSDQAPNGMLRRSVVNWPGIVRTQVRKARNGS